MINLIKMNLYNMIRMRALKIILGVAVLLLVIIYSVSLKMDLDNTNDDVNIFFSETAVENLKSAGVDDEMIDFLSKCELSQEIMDEIDNGNISEENMAELFEMFESVETYPEDEDVVIGFESNVTAADATVMDFVLADFTSGITLLFLSIATCLFVHSDEKNGYIKNIVGQCKHKCYVYLAKIVAIFSYAIIFLATYAATMIIMCKLFGDDIEFMSGSVSALMAKLGVIFLITMGYICGVAMLTSVMRSSSFPMVVGIVFTLGFEMLVFGNLDNLLDTKIYQYAPVNMLSSVCNMCKTSQYMKGVMVAVVLLVVYNVVGSLIIEKRDAV